MIAKTPKPPYYAVIFTSLRTTEDADGYAAAAKNMEELAARQPGFLGLETARNENGGIGLTVSYWRDLDSIRRWKIDAQHQQAQKMGRTLWYADYAVRIAKVEREYCKTERR